MTSRSEGMATVRAVSMTRSMSAGVTSRSLMAMMPWLLMTLVWPPPTPA